MARRGIAKDEADLPLFARVKRALWRDIQAGQFTARLPSEVILAARYEVSRMTLRRAIGELVQEGFLSSRRGAGNFVRGQDAPLPPTRSLGFLLDRQIDEGLDDPYFSAIFSALVAACARHGYTVTAAARLADLVAAAPGRPGTARRQVDGLIASGFDVDSVATLASLRLPLVLLDSAPLAGRWTVVPDNAGGARLAVDHLLDLGHRHIAHLAGPHTTIAATEREAAWRAALARRGIRPPRSWRVSGDFTAESGYAGISRLMKARTRPTAVFCANDRMAIGALRWLIENAVTVPGQVSLMGFDDIEAGLLCYPRLSTVSIPRVELAEAAARRLFALLAGGSRSAEKPRLERVATRLTVRETSAPPRR